jgi:hypothetical protein
VVHCVGPCRGVDLVLVDGELQIAIGKEAQLLLCQFDTAGALRGCDRKGVGFT